MVQFVAFGGLLVASCGTLLVGCTNDLMGLPESYADADVDDDARSIEPMPDAGVADAKVFIEGQDVTRDTSLSWRERVRLLVDEQTLTAYFEQNGGVPRYAVDIYAVAIEERPGGLAYRYFDVNKGAFSQAFWPASTIKVMACLAALTQIKSWGYSGEATVTWSGYSDKVRSIVDRAIRVSSNADYDRCLQIAGHDFVNGEWLTEANGFPTTVLKASYARLGVINVPAFTLSEGDMKREVSARRGEGTYSCDSGGSNCTTLYELVEALRRMHLAPELDATERFDIHEADRVALVGASCQTNVSYFRSGAKRALGSNAQVCNKAGWVPDADYLDHALITLPSGRRFLGAAAVPDNGSPDVELEQIGETLARFVDSGAHEGDFWLQPQFGEQGRLMRTDDGLFAVGGSSLRVYVEGKMHAQGASPLRLDDHDLPEHWLTIEVLDQTGELIGVRHAELAQ